jgi:hypothetical protein
MNNSSTRLPLFTVLFVLLATDIRAAEPERLVLGEPVALTGTIIREFDMSFVDSDLGPIQDPKEVARAVAEARRRNPVDESRPHKPSPHLILRLDKPISVRTQSGEDEKRNISEIDLGGSAHRIQEKEFGKTRFVVSGTLWRAETVHHLRPVMMEVTTLKRAR